MDESVREMTVSTLGPFLMGRRVERDWRGLSKAFNGCLCDMINSLPYWVRGMKEEGLFNHLSRASYAIDFDPNNPIQYLEVGQDDDIIFS